MNVLKRRSVEVNVPAGLKGGEKFQLQIKQPQYNSEAGLNAFINSKLSTLPQREKAFKDQQGRYVAQQRQYVEQREMYERRQREVKVKEEREKQQQIAQQQQQVQAAKQQEVKQQAILQQQQQAAAAVEKKRKPLPTVSGPKVDLVLDGKGGVKSGDFTASELRALTLGVLKFGGFEWSKILESEEFGGALGRRDADSCSAKFGEIVARREKEAKKEEDEREAKDKKEVDEIVERLEEAVVRKKKRNGGEDDLEEKAWEEVLKKRCEEEGE